MCPLMAGGSVTIAGEARVGIVVVTEELVQRLSRGPDRVSLFPLVPLTPTPSPDWSFAEELKKEAGSECTVGPVQTFFFRGEDQPWTEDRLAGLSAFDTVIHLSRERIRANIYSGGRRADLPVAPGRDQGDQRRTRHDPRTCAAGDCRPMD